MLPEPQEPECLPPQQIINGVCQFLQPTTFRPSIRPFFTTSTTPAPPPTSTIPPPIGLPRPSYPKKIEPLPTLPPKIAEKTFINPPLITNTFSVSQFLCMVQNGYYVAILFVWTQVKFEFFHFDHRSLKNLIFKIECAEKNCPLFFQGAFDYCANLGGYLPSFDFFDVVNIGERPRTSGSNDTSVPAAETDEGTSVERKLFVTYDETEPEEEDSIEENVYESKNPYEDSQESEPEYNEIDTGILIVNQQGEERKLLRGKRQLPSPWYWINNYNDGRTCYAALPGDIVKFRAFSCKNILRVICQRSKTDRTWLQSQVQKVEKQVDFNPGSLENQVPESIIRANPKKALFKVSGLTNPYLNYHAKQMKRRQQLRQQQLELAPFLNLRLYFGF